MTLRAASLKAAALGVLRSRGRLVCWTPEFMGFGNVLYVLHWVATQRVNGQPMWARPTTALQPWLPIFSELKELLLDGSQVRFTDQRIMPWSPAFREGMPESLHASGRPRDADNPYGDFIKGYLLPGLNRRGDLKDHTRGNDTLVVNVRRGDYYSVAQHRHEFGFDVAAFVDVAVRSSLSSDGPVQGIHVVSDDIPWCRRELPTLPDLAPTVSYADPESAPVSDLLDLIGARRLVLSNSTFSYWGALVSNAVHGDNYNQVWAPRFFNRTQNGGRSPLLDERWRIIEDLPNGWEGAIT